MQRASALAAGNFYGEPWDVEPKKPRVSLRAPIRELLLTGWWTVPNIARRLNILPPLALYHVRELARFEIVFCKKRGERGGGSWARAYRIYPRATEIRAMGRVK